MKVVLLLLQNNNCEEETEIKARSRSVVNAQNIRIMDKNRIISIEHKKQKQIAKKKEQKKIMRRLSGARNERTSNR